MAVFAIIGTLLSRLAPEIMGHDIFAVNIRRNGFFFYSIDMAFFRLQSLLQFP